MKRIARDSASIKDHLRREQAVFRNTCVWVIDCEKEYGTVKMVIILLALCELCIIIHCINTGYVYTISDTPRGNKAACAPRKWPDT